MIWQLWNKPPTSEKDGSWRRRKCRSQKRSSAVSDSDATFIVKEGWTMTKFSPLINAHNAISASGLACTFFVVPLEQASFRSALRQGRKCLQQIVLAGAIANLRRELRCTTRLDPSSALFGSLREKRPELRHNLGAVAVRALNALLFVLTDRHRKGETLATLLAKIFVKRHINPRY